MKKEKNQISEDRRDRPAAIDDGMESANWRTRPAMPTTRPSIAIARPIGRAAAAQPVSPADQRRTSDAMRDPCSPSISGPKACRRAGAPSACTTSSGFASGLRAGTSRMRGRPENEFSSFAILYFEKAGSLLANQHFCALIATVSIMASAGLLPLGTTASLLVP